MEETHPCRQEEMLKALPLLVAAEDEVHVVHRLVVCRQHDQVFDLEVCHATSLAQKRMDCCPVLPLVAEYPYLALKQTDYFPDEECRLVELVYSELQRAFLLWAQPSLLQPVFLQEFQASLLP
jgi:hypothetical protein